MRKVLLFLIIIVSFSSFQSYQEKEIDPLVFNDTIYHFDTIQAKAKHYSTEFVCRNQGQSPIYIIKATTDCGCTYANYSKEPILPGDSSIIKVGYISLMKSHDFLERIYVHYHYDDMDTTKVLQITGYVIPRKVEY